MSQVIQFPRVRRPGPPPPCVSSIRTACDFEPLADELGDIFVHIAAGFYTDADVARRDAILELPGAYAAISRDSLIAKAKIVELFCYPGNTYPHDEARFKRMCSSLAIDTAFVVLRPRVPAS